MSEIILKKQDTDTINLLSLLLWSKAKGVLLLWQKLLLSSFFSKKAKVHIDTKLERRRTLLMPCYFCHFFSNLFCCYSSRAGVLLTIHCTFRHIIVQEEEPITNQLFIIFYSKNIPNHSLLKLWKSFFILLHYYPCSLCSVHFLN